MTEHLTRESVETMCRAAPFADAEVGIPEMVAALRALVVERDAAHNGGKLRRFMEIAIEEDCDQPMTAAEWLADFDRSVYLANALCAALAPAEHKTRGAP